MPRLRNLYTMQDARAMVQQVDLVDYDPEQGLADLGDHRTKALPLGGTARKFFDVEAPSLDKLADKKDVVKVTLNHEVHSVWDTIYDPEIDVSNGRDDGLGSGHFHRTGLNFRPEEGREVGGLRGSTNHRFSTRGAPRARMAFRGRGRGRGRGGGSGYADYDYSGRTGELDGLFGPHQGYVPGAGLAMGAAPPKLGPPVVRSLVSDRNPRLPRRIGESSLGDNCINFPGANTEGDIIRHRGGVTERRRPMEPELQPKPRAPPRELFPEHEPVRSRRLDRENAMAQESQSRGRSRHTRAPTEASRAPTEVSRNTRAPAEFRPAVDRGYAEPALSEVSRHSRAPPEVVKAAPVNPKDTGHWGAGRLATARDALDFFGPKKPAASVLSRAIPPDNPMVFQPRKGKPTLTVDTDDVVSMTSSQDLSPMPDPPAFAKDLDLIAPRRAPPVSTRGPASSVPQQVTEVPASRPLPPASNVDSLDEPPMPEPEPPAEFLKASSAHSDMSKLASSLESVTLKATNGTKEQVDRDDVFEVRSSADDGSPMPDPPARFLSSIAHRRPSITKSLSDSPVGSVNGDVLKAKRFGGAVSDAVSSVNESSMPDPPESASKPTADNHPREESQPNISEPPTAEAKTPAEAVSEEVPETAPELKKETYSGASTVVARNTENEAAAPTPVSNGIAPGPSQLAPEESSDWPPKGTQVVRSLEISFEKPPSLQQEAFGKMYEPPEPKVPPHLRYIPPGVVKALEKKAVVETNNGPFSAKNQLKMLERRRTSPLANQSTRFCQVPPSFKLNLQWVDENDPVIVGVGSEMDYLSISMEALNDELMDLSLEQCEAMIVAADADKLYQRASHTAAKVEQKVVCDAAHLKVRDLAVSTADDRFYISCKKILFELLHTHMQDAVGKPSPKLEEMHSKFKIFASQQEMYSSHLEGIAGHYETTVAPEYGRETHQIVKDRISTKESEFSSVKIDEVRAAEEKASAINVEKRQQGLTQANKIARMAELQARMRNNAKGDRPEPGNSLPSDATPSSKATSVVTEELDSTPCLKAPLWSKPNNFEEFQKIQKPKDADVVSLKLYYQDLITLVDARLAEIQGAKTAMDSVAEISTEEDNERAPNEMEEHPKEYYLSKIVQPEPFSMYVDVGPHPLTLKKGTCFPYEVRIHFMPTFKLPDVTVTLNKNESWMATLTNQLRGHLRTYMREQTFNSWIVHPYVKHIIESIGKCYDGRHRVHMIQFPDESSFLGHDYFHRAADLAKARAEAKKKGSASGKNVGELKKG